MPSIHQVNHPGSEFSFSYRARRRHNEDYSFDEDSRTTGIRYWNRRKINGKDNAHYRKFLEIENCRYIDELKGASGEKKGTLRFWGEYEGHSFFNMAIDQVPSEAGCRSPKAIHRPFFCKQGMNDQNTDPFVFGDVMYYAICRKNRLKNIQPGDLILFGSEFGEKSKERGIDEAHFYLDTLFVVAEALPPVAAKSFSTVYMTSTLERIGITEGQRGEHPIHTAAMYQDNPRRFSFVCGILPGMKLPEYGRPRIDTKKLQLLTPGARTGARSRELERFETIESIWEDIAREVLRGGFVLGTRIAELPVLDALLCSGGSSERSSRL